MAFFPLFSKVSIHETEYKIFIGLTGDLVSSVFMYATAPTDY